MARLLTMRIFLAAPISTLLGLALVAGCTSEQTADGVVTVGDGRFVLSYEDAPDSLATIARQVQAAGVVDDAVALLDEEVALPGDVAIEVRSCTSGTGYDPEERTIEICLEEIQETRDLLRDADADDRGATERGILAETVMHEAGHALIDVLELQFTGREEDVADQFSAYLLSRDEQGADALEAVAYGYEVSAAAYEAEPSDEHTSDAQRAVNFQCWVYGADLRDSDYLIDDTALTEERADFCPEELTDLRDGWTALLQDAGALR